MPLFSLPPGTPHATDVADLLDDAKLLADYGVRSGCFGVDEPLLEAIKAAELKGSELGWKSDETLALQKAFVGALRKIYPVTLPDLKATWRSDAQYGGIGARVRAFLTKSTVIVATACVVLLCASLTVWQQRATSLVGELAIDKIGKQQAAFDELLVLTGSDKIAELRNPASPLRESFRQKQREIEGIERSMAADVFTAERLSASEPIGTAIGHWLEDAAAGARALLTLPAAAVVPSTSADELVPASVPAAAVSPSVVATPAGAIRLAANDAKAAAGAGAEAFDCSSANTQYLIDRSNAALNASSDENAIRSLRLFMSAVDFDRAFINRMKCQLDHGPDQVLLSAFEIKYRLDIVSLWWLPALYGALGALVYHLREFLSGTRPDPTFLKMLVRVGLGAFAGIAIGWFWLPADASVLGIPEITFTPLSIAFIVGFGIDAFVAVLDRIVVSINRWIANPVAPAQ